jgi:putative cell wall-binding protein
MKTQGGWLHNGTATGAIDFRRVSLNAFDATGSTDKVLAVHRTEANQIDDDSNGIVDDEDWGPTGATGDWRLAASAETTVNPYIQQGLQLGGNFLMKYADEDIAFGSADTTAPAAPTNLDAEVDGTTATLTWDPATDDVGVTAYHVYRWVDVSSVEYTPPHVKIATVTDTTFEDTGLTPQVTYNYEVRAADAATNVSARSNAAQAAIPNTPPVAVDDAYATAKNTALAVSAPGVLANDTDADSGDTLNAVKVTDPANGTVLLGSDGSFVYTPNTGFTGVDSFTYVANDGLDDSAPATVSITVSASTVTRLAARTRFSTAVEIAKVAYPGPAGRIDIIIASGDDRAAADPLAASGLCWAYDAPMMLVSAARTPDEVKAAVAGAAAANGTVTLRVVGGPVSVPDARLAELVAAGGGPAKVKIDRIRSTGSRYDLAAAIAARMKAVRGAEMPPVALIANGADPNTFFDALALSPIATGKGAPILLVTADTVPAATAASLNALKPTTIIVGGGPNTVRESVRASLGATRWSGRTRYDTAIAIANGAVGKGWLNRKTIGIAAKLPDALTGGTLAGVRGGVMVLTDGTTLTPATQSWLATYKAQIAAVYVFGGPLSISDAVVNQIRNAIK